MIAKLLARTPRRLFTASLLVTLVVSGLSHAETKPLAADHAERMAKGLDLFKTHVRQVLEQRCLRCHGGKSTEGAFDLSDRETLLRGGESGPAVLLGKGKLSLLYQLVTHAKEPHMPSSGAKLSAESAGQLADWIDLDAPYDKPLIEKKKVNASAWTVKQVPPAAKQFWSFQPLRRVEPPMVKDMAWCQTPIDRFVLAKLEAAGVTPNPAVERRQLIRRVYFDVIGLPPTPDEVNAFSADQSPTAYETLIDKLLASPHYGERWGRHWLDLARFAESHGFEHDYDRATAYHYRDFVIKALNQDLPYDTFVRWQLAGDEFEPKNNLALTATGFLAAGVHSTQITIKEVAKQRYDELDDCVATVGTAMLGLTLGCARCHDHKFDPLPQRDYYRMLSTFTTTVRTEVDLDLDPAGYQLAKAAYETAHAPLVATLKQFQIEQLPERLAAWEQKQGVQTKRPRWTTLELLDPKSAGGATFSTLDDGSLLVGGKKPANDTFTFTARTTLTGIRAVRLEALSHPSLVKGGPGRADNGNFALTDFRLTATGADGKPVAVNLRNPQATFEQKGLPIAAALDDSPLSGWAVDPEFGKDHAALFELETPLGDLGGTTLQFTLQFKNNISHSIGRPRLSLWADAATPTLTGVGYSAALAKALAVPAARRSAEQITLVEQWYRTTDPEWRALAKKVQDHEAAAPKPTLAKALIASEGLPALRLHTQGADFLPETNFLRRGDPDQPDGVATQGFIQVVTSAVDQEKHWPAEPPKGSRSSYRRRALANWITDVDQGAGALLARVIVNRLWQHHFGKGLVVTPSDFGARGEKPTHPELLDWLATELIRGGWRLKAIHKAMLLSAVYREMSLSTDAKLAVDRDNKLLWRRPVHRLEAEVIRDAMLAVGGVLDPTQFGPGTLDESSRRRSLYFTVKRSKQIPMMQVFDAPDALQGIGERPNTTIAPQALLLMNNPHVRAWAKAFARRAAPTNTTAFDEAVRSAYRIALGRPPSNEELADGVGFVQAQLELYRTAGKADDRAVALADFCQTLFCLNEFVFVD